MSTQQLENQQILLSRRFIGEGNPFGVYLTEEDVRRQTGISLTIEPPKLGELKAFQSQVTYPLGMGSDTCKAAYHHLGCTILLSKCYPKSTMKQSGFNHIIGVREFPTLLEVITEEQDNLERCSEYLRGLGYNEFKHEESE